MPIADVAKLQSLLLVGSTLRKEQPLFANRIRQAAKKGMAVNVVHVADDELLMPIANREIVKPSELAAKLAAIAAAVADGSENPIAASLKGRERSAILLGHYAQQHPDFAILLAIAQEIGRLTGATVGVLPDGANAVGAHLAGVMPSGSGLDARAMIASPRRGYIVAGVEAELEMGPKALAALGQAEFGVVLSAYRNATTDGAHVMLPITPFSETAGTFVNMEGRVQSFNAVVKPQGDSRPLWKVLRMLGALLEIPGFHAEKIEEVRAGIAPDLQVWATQRLDNGIAEFERQLRSRSAAVERVAEFAIYATDPIVRRSLPLQKTADAKNARLVRFHPATAAALNLAAGAQVRIRQGGGEITLPVGVDAALPEGVMRIARGIPETAMLGEGDVSIEVVKLAAVA
jgi:NADH-quinone oxidoreductase subunit G